MKGGVMYAYRYIIRDIRGWGANLGNKGNQNAEQIEKKKQQREMDKKSKQGN